MIGHVVSKASGSEQTGEKAARSARTQCTTATRTGRQLYLRPREIHQAAAARTAETATGFHADYNRRAGIEGTIHQATSHGTRYRGLAKTHLQHIYLATALNLIRLDAHWNNQPLDRQRTSHLARLAAQNPN